MILIEWIDSTADTGQFGWEDAENPDFIRTHQVTIGFLIH